MGRSIRGEAPGDNCGKSIALSGSGDVLIVGCYMHDGPTGIKAGQVRIFEWKGDDWAQVGSDIEGKEAEREFGSPVAISLKGNVVGIGGIAHARIFERADEWEQLGDDLKGEAFGDKFGWSLSLSTHGTLVAVGAKMNDGVHGRNSGHVRVLRWSNNSWSQVGEDMDGAAARDEFGWSVSMAPSGETVAVGAVHHESNAGMARVLEWTGHRWDQVGEDIVGRETTTILGTL